MYTEKAGMSVPDTARMHTCEEDGDEVCLED